MTEVTFSTDHVFVVSDLHLSGEPSELENFVLDNTLEHFVEEEMASVCGTEPRTLVINGDFIDFPRIRPSLNADEQRPGIGSTEAESLEKLDVALTHHPKVTEALKRHTRAGNQLVLVPGNHDVDLYWPKVRARLTEEAGPFEFAAAGFIRSRGVYLDHGHQHSFENRFSSWPNPFVQGTDRLERCWGTFFMEAVYNAVEFWAPWMNMIHPATLAVRLGLKHQGWDKIPPPLAPRIVAFLMRYGKKLAYNRVLGDSKGELTLAELETWVGQKLPPSHRDAVARQASELLQSPLVPGALGSTDERGIASIAKAELARGDVRVAISGHTHRRRENAEGNVLNTGCWTGAIEALETDTFEALCEKAEHPTTRPTYAYCDLSAGTTKLGVARGPEAQAPRQ